MKRAMSILLAMSLVLSVAVMASSTASATAVLYGDINGDGKINNRDLAAMQKYLNGVTSSVDTEAADVRYDGKINNRDLAQLQKYLNGYAVQMGPEQPVVPPVELPTVGYDLDDRGRILVDAISQDGYTITVVLHNYSDKWMTEETSYVNYTCTDAEGNVLTLDNKYFGTLYIGMLEVGDVMTYTITLPEGTVKLEFGGYDITYWSQWA